MIEFKFLIIGIALLALSSGSDSDDTTGFSSKDGAFYTDDAVIINATVLPARLIALKFNTKLLNEGAHVERKKRDIVNASREEKQLVLLQRQQIDDGAFGLECETTVGKRGTCRNFRDCYPFVKVADISGWDGWVMGHYDTCSYISGDNTEVFGVCCTEPVGTPAQQVPDVQRMGLLPQPIPVQLPPTQIAGVPGGLISALSPQWPFMQDANFRQIPPNWPPPIPPLPTHPPHHTAPTHPPSIVAGVTTKPPTTKPTASTTWPTRPPSTTKPTTKQPWPPAFPAQPTKPSFPTKPSQPAVSGSCGIKNGPTAYGITDVEDEERIVGGHNADLNEWPWIVALMNNGRQFCGGSLMDDRHVLSAAHCVAHMTSWDVARLTARLGDYNIRTNSETQHIERKIKRVVRHRGFDMRTLYNDIAILTLDQPVTFTKNIRPVCLPSGGRMYAGSTATVIGWGSLRESGPQPSVLQEVSIPIWTNSECRLKYGAAAPGGIVDHMICAGKASMDSCSGDSGGPMMVNEGGIWNQVGVVSWGIGCGKGQYPGVYTRVTSFMPWIQKNSKQ